MLPRGALLIGRYGHDPTLAMLEAQLKRAASCGLNHEEQPSNDLLPARINDTPLLWGMHA